MDRFNEMALGGFTAVIVKEITMAILMKVLISNIVGVLTVGLLGCGCLYPFTPQSPNLYADVYKANDLRDSGKYEAAIVKYEQALKKLPRFPTDTKVVNVSFPTFLKYHIAFCYTKLAEAEADVSLYVKAETAVRESYKTSILPSDQADALYLWGYILFKQGRYEEARAKYEGLVEAALQSEYRDDFTAVVWYALGKTHLKLGDEAAARRVFAAFEVLIETALESYNTSEALYPLGKEYLKLGDEVAARAVFGKLEGRIEADLQRFGVRFHGVDFYEDTLYGLGNIYMELSDNDSARRVFAQLLKHFPDSPHKAEVGRLLQKQ